MRDILFRFILPMSATGGALYLASLLMRPVFAKTGAKLHKRLLAAVAALFLLPLPLLFSLLSMPGQATAPAGQTNGEPTAVLATTLRNLAPAAPAYHAGRALSAAARPEAPPAAAGGGTAGATATGNMDLDLPFLAAAVYLTGAAAVLCTTAGRWLFFTVRLRRASRPVTDDAILRAYREAQGQLKLRKAPALLESGAVSAPLLAYLPKPAIVLPAGAADGGQAEFALAHELIHYKSKDVPLKYLALAVCMLHWFNPLAWVYKRELSEVCERACDEQMVREMDAGARCSYARTLVAYAEGAPAFAAGFSSPARHLKKRLRNLLAHKKASRGITIFSSVLLLITVAAIVLAGCGMAAGTADTGESASEPSETGAPDATVSNFIGLSLSEVEAIARTTEPPEPPPDGVMFSITVEDAEKQCGTFTWPVPDYTSILQTSSGFYDHDGVDIAASPGSAVIAVRGGKVSYARGSFVIIAHGNDSVSSYANLDALAVQEGDAVEEGQQLGVIAAAPIDRASCRGETEPMCHYKLSVPLEMPAAVHDGNEEPETQIFTLSDPMFFTYNEPYPYGTPPRYARARGTSEPEESTSAVSGTGLAYISPLAEPVLSQRGFSDDGHRGLDFTAEEGTPVYAMADGVVVQATYHYSWGNMVLIEHSDGLQTLYAHMSYLAVDVGQTVAQGQQVGAIGMTGNTTGPILHLEVWGADGVLVDPMEILPDGAVDR